MKIKQYLAAILPAAGMLAVILLNVGVENKVSALYAQAYTAVQNNDSSQVYDCMNQLERIAPGYVPQYELYAQFDLKNGNREAAYSILMQGIQQTGSNRLMQFADAIAAGTEEENFALKDAFQSGGLPSVLPEDWNADTSETEGSGQLSLTRMNYNFVVRYPGSALGNEVQLGLEDGASTEGMQWSSSDPAVATVSSSGVVHCNAKAGETKITVAGNGREAECWVCVVEPEIYANDETDFTYMSMGSYYYIPEGNFSLNVNYDLEEALKQTEHGSGVELMPHIAVTGDIIGAESYPYGATAVSAGSAATDYDMIDQNGNPYIIDQPETGISTPESSDGEHQIGIQPGWESLYFSGEYHIPEALRCGGTTYTTTSIDFSSSQNYGVTSISLPASVVSLGRNADSKINPFAGYKTLEKFSVDEENPAFQSIDGVLYNADGTELIAYPAGADTTEYTIPDGVTSIWLQAFMDNKTLQKLSIPASVTEIGWGAMDGMVNLQEIDLDPENMAFKMEDGVLKSSDGHSVYAAAQSQMPTDYTVGADVKEINGSVFSGNSRITSLTVDASTIGLVVQDCSSLETLIVNGDLNNLSVSGCPKMKSIAVNSTVSTIALSGMEQTVDVELNGEAGAFSAYLTPVNLVHPEKITGSLTMMVGDTMPSGFSDSLLSLSVDLNGNDQALDMSVIGNCKELSSLTLSNGKVSGLSVLSGLSKLRSLRFNKVSADRWDPVWDCVELTELNITNTDTLTDISGVSALSELRSVDFSNTAISDVSSLAECENLYMITIDNCKNVSDVSMLEDLPNLQNLNNSNYEIG